MASKSGSGGLILGLLAVGGLVALAMKSSAQPAPPPGPGGMAIKGHGEFQPPQGPPPPLTTQQALYNSLLSLNYPLDQATSISQNPTAQSLFAPLIAGGMDGPTAARIVIGQLQILGQLPVA